MQESIIKVENISKRYRINTLRAGGSLLDQLRGMGAGLFKRAPQDYNNPDDYLWALRDVSFDIKRGEVVGIVGKNGSGKSTMLKLLSRITRPTSGRIELAGKVASLLEVGTGFHPELSGRENIFMNAAVLGMSRAETRNKFDEIVDFAEVGRFIDTPIKRYSSGMYMRLAFAVAAHLDPDILLVDEVLAVGDSNFQKKSLGKMNEVSRMGRTVLFVSHNMAAMTALCPRSILLSYGEMILDGPTGEVIQKYLQEYNTAATGEISWDDAESAPQSERIRMRCIRVINDGKVTADVDIQKDIVIQADYENLKDGSKVLSALLLQDKVGADVLASANMTSANLNEDPWFDTPAPAGLYRVQVTIPGNFLNEGQYSIQFGIQTDINHIEVELPNVLNFTVHETGAMRQEFTGDWRGLVRPRLAWTTEQVTKR